MTILFSFVSFSKCKSKFIIQPLSEYKQISCPWTKKKLFIRKQKKKQSNFHGDYVNLIQKDKRQNNNRFIND